MSYELRPVAGHQADAYARAVLEAFHRDASADELARWRPFLEPERTLAAFADGEIVATSGLLSLRMAVPGGATVRVAGLTAVGVHAVHRGAGLLDRMIAGHLEAIRERGAEAVAVLYASEAGIYGRYGFGIASRAAALTVRSPEARLRAPAADRPRHGAPAELLGELRAVYAAVQPERPGMLVRDDRFWGEAIADVESEREGAGRLRALVADGDDGPAGYALFAVRKHEPDDRPADVVVVRELLAATPEAAATLWGFLIGLALSRSVVWSVAPVDEPLRHMLTDFRAVDVSTTDALQARLVDLPRALAERAYSAPVDVVLDVADARCPWNAGRWRLAGDAGGATCERTTAPADLALDAAALGAVHLGGTRLAVLGAAGRVQARTRGALDAASRAFAGVREPWCADHF